jgi:hypothetical protein
MLCGILVVLPDERIQLPVAIMVCLTSIILLTTFQPHRSRIVFHVCQLAFIATTVKFVAGLQLRTTITKNRGEFKKQVGIFLVCIDVGVFMAAIGSVFLLVWYLVIKGKDIHLHAKVSATGRLQKSLASQVKQSNASNQKSKVNSSLSRLKFRNSVAAALQTKHVFDKVANHRASLGVFQKKTEEQQIRARSRVKSRLSMRRKRSKGSITRKKVAKKGGKKGGKNRRSRGTERNGRDIKSS